MTPTMKLRFVIRGDDFNAGKTEQGDFVTLYDKKVLQQWWKASEFPTDGEWRDVPVEEEK